MRVLFFGSGSPASVIALDAVARAATISGVVVPKSRAAAPLVAASRRHGFNTFFFGSKLERADLLCIATFPSVLPPEILQFGERGGINAHMSLLPRHRGPDPLFWTYMSDDRWTGVTVHWLDDKADGGPIILQREIRLERGRSVLEVYNDLADIGGDLLASAVRLISAGTAPRIAQDESLATREPSRNATSARVDAAAWPAERVWHVLRGLTIKRGTLLGIAHGVPREYFVVRHDRAPGTIERIGKTLRVYCTDGYVDIDAAPRASLFGKIVRRLRRLTKTSFQTASE